jgi:hypothetical protein
MLPQYVASQTGYRITKVELGCFTKEDKVTVYGSKGKIEFSIFDEVPIILNEKE